MNNAYENLPISPKLSEFIGAIIGDGCLVSYLRRGRSNQSIRYIEITGDAFLDADYFFSYLSPLIKEQFGKTPRIYTANENTLRLRIYSQSIHDYIAAICSWKPGKKAYTITIPDVILNSSRENTLACIRGIFDTDGCVFLDNRPAYRKPYPRITLQMASKPLVTQLAELLEEDFKVTCRISSKDPTRNYIELYGHKQVQKWQKIVGFSNLRHSSKLLRNI